MIVEARKAKRAGDAEQQARTAAEKATRAASSSAPRARPFKPVAAQTLELIHEHRLGNRRFGPVFRLIPQNVEGDPHVEPAPFRLGFAGRRVARLAFGFVLPLAGALGLLGFLVRVVANRLSPARLVNQWM